MQRFADGLEILIPENLMHPIFNTSESLLFSVTTDDRRIETTCHRQHDRSVKARRLNAGRERT
jgi:hypothetical protein